MSTVLQQRRAHLFIVRTAPGTLSIYTWAETHLVWSEEHGRNSVVLVRSPVSHHPSPAEHD